MRRSLTLLLLTSSVVVASAFAPLPQDGEKKAEEEFKNIQSFKGVPASEIVPAMQFMSASLGVDCDFCHTEKGFEDDAKPEKKSARMMIAMTNEINTKNFNGRREVTCYTCHGGHEHPAGAPTLAGLTARIKRDDSKGADSVVAQYRTAIGGDAALGKVQNLHLTGTLHFGEQNLPVESYQTADGKFASLITLPQGGKQGQASDGKNVWVTNGGEPRKLDASDSGRVLRGNQFFWASSSLPSLERPAAGTAEIEGKSYDAVRGVVSGTGVLAVFYFDPQTHLLSRAGYFMPTILGSLPEIYDYSDYRKVGDIMLPFKIDQKTTSRTTSRQYDKAEENVKLDESMFKMGG